MNRAIKIIDEVRDKLKVDLSGYTVLTEIGSNNYIFTPIIASLCGAKKVYALAKDNSYGAANDIILKAQAYTESLGINNIEFFENTVPLSIYESIDILTNSGNLRPINKQIIDLLKPTAVIPLMFEAWEIRDEDINVSYCKERNIKVAGTWENHPDIKVFDYCGMLGVKMALEAGLEITGNKIIVWSNDHFGEVISSKFLKEQASVIQTTSVKEVYDNLKDTDLVFIADYDEQKSYFGEDAIFDTRKIKELNPSVVFVHLYGDVDTDFCKKNEINISPKFQGYPMRMTHTLGYVGLLPILKLQVAGLKVAQEMLTNTSSSLTQLL